MDDIAERHLPWERREGLVAIGVLPMADAARAVAASLGTARHARRFVDAVVRQLGARAFEDPAAPPGHRWVFVRDRDDPALIAPVPLVSLGPRSGMTVLAVRVKDGVTPVGMPEPAAPTGRLEPAGPGLEACALRLAEGTAHLELAYDPRGMLAEQSQSASDPWISVRYPYLRPYTVDPRARPPTPRPLALLCRPDLVVAGHPEEELAAMLVDGLDGRLGTLRVRMPRPIPGGVATALATGRRALRRALLEGEVDEPAGVVVADGLAGTAIACGPTRERALAAFGDAVFRVKPRPPAPAPPPPGAPAPSPREPPRTVRDDDGAVIGVSTGTLHLGGPSAASPVGWPPATPASTPAVLAPYEATTPEIPAALRAAGFGRWARVLGETGVVGRALVRERADETTMVGEHVLDAVSLDRLDLEMADAEADLDALLAHAGGGATPPGESLVAMHRVVDPATGAPAPCALVGSVASAEAAPWDGPLDALPWLVLRWRRR